MRRKTECFFLLSVLLVAFAVTDCSPKKEAPSTGAASFTGQTLTASQKANQLRTRFQRFIVGGTQQEAIDYYSAATAKIAFPGSDQSADTFAQLLPYLGYQGIQAGDLEHFVPGSTGQIATGDIVIATFFAPKIMDVSKPFPDATIDTGWRKAVWLRPQSGSSAAQHGVTGAYILFNYFQKSRAFEADKDPLKTKDIDANQQDVTQSSGNTQVILVRSVKAVASDADEHISYFVDYNASGQLSYKLDAFFDTLGTPGQLQPYFVPRACAQCHGMSESESADSGSVGIDNPQLNYLDTDWYFDRVQSGDDFANVAEKSFGVIYDGGKSPSDLGGAASPNPQKFHDAMDQFRAFNKLVKDQNVAALNENISRLPGDTGRDDDAFRVRSVSKWLNLHQTSDSYFFPVDRGLDSVETPEATWHRSTDPSDPSLPPNPSDPHAPYEQVLLPMSRFGLLQRVRF